MLFLKKSKFVVSRAFATAPKLFKEAEDFIPVNGTDHIEIYTSNAKQCAYWYQHLMGFQPLAYSGLETGSRDKTSYVLEQGEIRLIITSALKQNSPIGDHVAKHGDGVKLVSLKCDDATFCYEEAIRRGAKSYMEPQTYEDSDGEVKISGIDAYGETKHLFIERKNYSGVFLPNYTKWSPSVKAKDVGLARIDHVVTNVPEGEMNKVCEFYKNVFGFANLISFDDKDISTEFTSLRSKVMTSGNGLVKFPINEPAPGKRKSQIEEYLDFYHDCGVQHIAVTTSDILHTVPELGKRGCEFLRIPDAYYDSTHVRCGEVDEQVETLKKYGILVDRDEGGYLLQIFTRPIGDRPTLFFEVIQRKGAQSFGKGNFKALFESIEKEQEKRGTL
eukprot:GHVL01001604.1.p1 GENE.GHVL01001604.1~~GHVL01001604.1.p1  ORF type:complete len:388 (+),score=45.78 GHVL01001604.1:150-1313(+)